MNAMLFHIIKTQVLLTQHSRIFKWQQSWSYLTCFYDHHVAITDGRY